jgi:hypothetical protein
MTMPAMCLEGVDYKPDPAKTNILRLIRADDPDGIWLARCVKEMEASGFLKGRCLEASSNREAALWLLSGRRNHLIYVYLRHLRKIGYLMVFNGDVDDHLPEARRRLQQLTS